MDILTIFVIGPTMARRASLPGSGQPSRKSSRSATVKTPQIMIGLDSPLPGDGQR